MNLKGVAELQVTKGKKQWADKEKARLLEMQSVKRQEEREVLPGQEDQSQSPGQTEEDTGVSSGKDLEESKAESRDFRRILNTYLRTPSIIFPKVNSTRKPYCQTVGQHQGKQESKSG